MSRLKAAALAWLELTPIVMGVWTTGGMVGSSTVAVYESKLGGHDFEHHAVAAARGAVEGAIAGGLMGGFVWITIPVLPLWLAVATIVTPDPNPE